MIILILLVHNREFTWNLTHIVSNVCKCNLLDVHFQEIQFTLCEDLLRKEMRTRCVCPAGVYLLKVNNKNTRTTCEICSKLLIKTPERLHWRRSGVFIVNFEQISHIVIWFLLFKCRLSVIHLTALMYNCYRLMQRIACKNFITPSWFAICLNVKEVTEILETSRILGIFFHFCFFANLSELTNFSPPWNQKKPRGIEVNQCAEIILISEAKFDRFGKIAFLDCQIILIYC